MSETLKRFATPFINGLFIVSLVSGLALFFHVGTAAFRGMHEWLSLVLIVPFVLHIWKNWRPMLLYLGKLPFTIASVASLIAALAFAYPALTGTGTTGGPPHIQLMRSVLASSASIVAPILGATPEKLVAFLQEKGFAAASADLTLSDIAAKSGKDEMELLAALLAIKSAP